VCRRKETKIGKDIKKTSMGSRRVNGGDFERKGNNRNEDEEELIGRRGGSHRCVKRCN